jgi:hypothetical protein
VTSTILALRLQHAAGRLADRLGQLEERFKAGDDTAWTEYATVASALASVAAEIAPERSGRLMSTAEMAEKLGIAPKTLLKRRANGEVRPVLQLGKRGRAALRWNGTEVPR